MGFSTRTFGTFVKCIRTVCTVSIVERVACPLCYCYQWRPTYNGQSAVLVDWNNLLYTADMTKMRKSPEAELRANMRRIKEGIEEGEKLKHDKSQYHTLDEFPEPMDDITKIVRKRPGKRDMTEKQKAQLKKLHDEKIKLWLPGQSGNPAGRPPGSTNKYDPLKQIGMQLAFTNASLVLTAKQRKLAKKLGYAPGDVRLVEALMIHLATSNNPNKIALFLERTFGKVPNINIHAQYNEDLVKRFSSKLTDSELEAIAEGADVLEILLSKLPDVDEVDSVHSSGRMDMAVDGTVVEDSNTTSDGEDGSSEK